MNLEELQNINGINKITFESTDESVKVVKVT